MSEQGPGQDRVLDLERWPMPDSMDNPEFHDWVHNLDASKYKRLSDEIVEWLQRERPLKLEDPRIRLFRSDPALTRAIHGDAYDRRMEGLREELEAEGYQFDDEGRLQDPNT